MINNIKKRIWKFLDNLMTPKPTGEPWTDFFMIFAYPAIILFVVVVILAIIVFGGAGILIGKYLL